MGSPRSRWQKLKPPRHARQVSPLASSRPYTTLPMTDSAESRAPTEAATTPPLPTSNSNRQRKTVLPVKYGDRFGTEVPVSHEHASPRAKALPWLILATAGARPVIEMVRVLTARVRTARASTV